MKKEIYYCDICKEELSAPRKNKDGEHVQVIFTTEQNEGRVSKPYLEMVRIDWCEQCQSKLLSGHALFASGAMGYNKYWFKTV